ncbi:hypothetical protein [Bradyrhizobium sp. CCGUVB23]|uniref:hypothetical protein n=1 Tax=Bradyrhizobium sp. CCGUVB23 TaxID=2949630 RepID=UPI0020B45B14|nr:hypothetical protein [Bradyrhizobium sp. CCGUVB23]MCP3468694.1 hypothetical protein [Bradyrhizobium sp. CCGUVB23]
MSRVTGAFPWLSACVTVARARLQPLRRDSGRKGREGGQPPDRALVRTALAVQQRITASVHGEIPEREQLEKALATLWAPLDHPAAARPVLALWFNEVKPPAGPQRAVYGLLRRNQAFSEGWRLKEAQNGMRG